MVHPDTSPLHSAARAGSMAGPPPEAIFTSGGTAASGCQHCWGHPSSLLLLPVAPWEKTGLTHPLPYLTPQHGRPGLLWEATGHLQLLLGARVVPAFAGVWKQCGNSARNSPESREAMAKDSTGPERKTSHHLRAGQPPSTPPPLPPPQLSLRPAPPSPRPLQDPAPHPRPRPSLAGPSRRGEGGGGAVPSLRLTQRAGGGAEVRKRRRRKWQLV